MSETLEQPKVDGPKNESEPKSTSEKNTSESQETIEDTKSQLAEMYLDFLDKQKGGMVGTVGELWIHINPLKKDAKEFLLTETSTKENKGIFSRFIKNITTKLTEKVTWGTILAYDKTNLNKMKSLINQYKNDQTKLKELMGQIEEGIDPTQKEPIASTEKNTSDTVPAVAETGEKINTKHFFQYPLVGAPVFSLFGPRKGWHHDGIDISPREGTEIQAIGAGEVESIWTDKDKNDSFEWYGNCVVIASKWPDGKTYHTLYGHMKEVFGGKVGEHIKAWDIVGLVGSTWKSTWPHLHLEIRQGDKKDFYKNEAINPLTVIPVKKSMMTEKNLASVDKKLLITDNEPALAA